MNSAVELLQALVRINSVNPSVRPGAPGEAECARFVAAWLREIGCTVEVQEVAPGRPQVLARLAGQDAGRRLLLETHMDTVQVDNMPGDPFSGELRDGRVYGRGSCDAKGCLAAMMWAMREVALSGPPPVDVWLLAAMDEEWQGQGIAHLMASGFRANAAIVGEPTELHPVIAHKGCLRFQVETRGFSVHTSQARQGRNAIYKMIDLIHRVRPLIEARLARRSDPLVGEAEYCISLIHGGSGVNTVPDRCVIDIDRRLLPGETPAAAHAELAGLIRETIGDDADVIVHPPYLAEPSLACPPDAPVARLLAGAVQAVIGQPAVMVGVPYGTDGSKVAAAGVPTLIFGPGSIACAHGAVEWLETDQLNQAVHILVHAIGGTSIL